MKDLETQLFGRKSERRRGGEDNNLVWAELLGAAQALAATPLPPPAKSPRKKSSIPMGPKPLDPALPREIIKVADPVLQELFCPVTKRPMQPAFVETLEVLARRPAVYYVQPYYRLEKHLARIGVDLPRVCQVSLMAQLDERMQPLVAAIQTQVWASGYIQLDATPIDLCDPARPGATRESTLWAYRATAGTTAGPVWFDFQLNKSPKRPTQLLENYRGLLQTDGASALDAIGQADGRVTHLGCMSHARRYFVKAVDAGEREAEPYLRAINRLFRLERLARHFRLTRENRASLRQRYSQPTADQLFADALVAAPLAPPKTRFGQALGYLLGQKPSLLRCLSETSARIDNNLVEQAIRPLKVGAKNWLQIGHPKAGPRLANLFTLVENCRLAGVDPEAYLVDIIARLPDHPMKRIAELLPHAWKTARTAAAAPSTPPAVVA